MKKILGSVVGFAFACSISSAAMAQDAAAGDMGANVTTNRALCGDSGECKAALTECENRLRDSQAGAEAALNATRECRAELIKKVPRKSAPPAPPACSGKNAVLVNGACECHVNVDGSGAIDPELVPVHRFGTGNLVVCVSGPEALALARELKGRFDREVTPNVPGWNAAKDTINVIMTQVNVPNRDPKAFAAQFNEMWQWYQEESKRQKRINDFLDVDLPRINGAINTLCPTIPAKADASIEERCIEAMNALKDTRVELRAGARGGFIHTPAAGFGGTVVASVELEHRPSRTTTTSLVVGAYGGITGDSNRGTGYIFGTEVGPRFYLDNGRHWTIDVLGYGQSRRMGHSAGYKGANSAWTGWDIGVRPRVAYCAGDSKSVCVGADLSAGYTPGDNAWTGAYGMNKKSGAVFGGGLSITGHIPLF